MPVDVNKDIFWFEVSVNDSLDVQVLKTQEDLNHVESGHVLRHSFVFFDETKHFASGTVLKNKRQIVGSLKGEFNLYNKGMIDGFHYVPLVHDNFCFFVLQNHPFVNEFHGIKFAIFLEPT